MKLYKELYNILIEISLAIFLIIMSYSVWDNFENKAFDTAKYYDNNKESEFLVEKKLDENIHYINDEKNSASGIIYLHNISKNQNDINLFLKLSKDIKDYNDYLIIKIDGNYFNFNDLIYKTDDNFYYLKITNDKFKAYETKDYKIKILINNNYYQYNNINFTYSFFTEL